MLSLASMNIEPVPGLAGRHKLDPIDIDMLGLVQSPVDRLGDIIRCQWVSSGIYGVGLALVATKAHHGELSLGKPRLDVGHTDACALQIAAQVQGKLFDERLGSAIDMATRVRPVTGNRAQIDDASARTVSDQSG